MFCGHNVDMETDMNNQKRTHWNTPVPVELNNKVEQAVIAGNHITKSEFIREAVRKQLKEQDGIL